MSDLIEERVQRLIATPDASLVAGVKRWYSARETARFFGRSPTWIYNRIAEKKFTDENGVPLTFKKIGDGPRPRMRFDLEIIKAMAESCYRCGIVSFDELKLIFRRVALSEYEEKITDQTLPEMNGI